MKVESDIAQKLAALQTRTDLQDEALLEATVRQGPGKYKSRYIPRTVAGPTFMDRKLQQLKVCLRETALQLCLTCTMQTSVAFILKNIFAF